MGRSSFPIWTEAPTKSTKPYGLSLAAVPQSTWWMSTRYFQEHPSASNILKHRASRQLVEPLFPIKGSATVPFKTEEGHDHQIKWSNAPVAMPILSTRLLAQDNGELRYQCDGGQICNWQRDEESHFVSASGVYFMKMFVKRQFTQLSKDPDVRTFSLDANGRMQIGGKADQGFGRQGTR